MTDLGVRMNLNYWASLRIGADGTIVGTTGLGDSPSGFVWRDGKLTVLGPIAGQSTTATGVGGGRVVGGTTTSIGEFRAHAFVWQNSRVTILLGPRLPGAPIASIDPTGTRIFAVSYETAGLRTRM